MMADFHLVPDRADCDNAPLSLAEAPYQALFAESPIGIHVSLPDGTLVDCNHAFARMLGFPSPAEAIGRNLTPLQVNGQGERWLARVREHGRVEHERGRLWRKDGGSLEVMASMVGAFDRAGTLIEVRGFVVDITRSAEAAEHGESIGRLAGAIAHDFNNLLMAILGYTELLLESRRPDDPDWSDLQQIQKAGQRAAALTQRLLAYSRKQVPVPKEVDLNDAIRSLRGMLTRLIRADISLTCAVQAEPALIKIDPMRLEQVVINLVLNARDALPQGGVIRLEVARVRLSEVNVPADQPTPADEYVRLSVNDNGVAISPEARAQVFEPVFTTKELWKGIGLGLASIYGIVRQSNGFISVDSEPGKGTTFTLHFPALASATHLVRLGGGLRPPGRATS
jgi:PAS domain S-box-containing protein